MTDDRSERLRKRRRRSRHADDDDAPEASDAAEEPSEADGGRRNGAEPAQPAEPSEPSKPSEPADGGVATNGEAAAESGDDAAREDGDATDGSVKDNQVGTYMYLPKSQTRSLSRVYNVLKAEYEYEFDEPFEKNRHFYPLVVRYGLARLEGMDAAAVRDRLEELER